MKEIQEKSILARVSEGSSYREVTDTGIEWQRALGTWLKLGTLRSLDADDNENVKKNNYISLINKTTTLRVHHTCLYISFPVFARLRRELKMPIFAFYGERKQAMTKLNFFF